MDGPADTHITPEIVMLGVPDATEEFDDLFTSVQQPHATNR